MNAFVARTQPLKMIIGIIIALIFVAVGVWMTGILDKPVTSAPVDDLIIHPLPQSPSRYPDWLIKTGGWVSIVFFGGVALVGAKRITSPSEHLRIDRMGVLVPSYTEHPIPWDQIEHIGTWSHRGQKALVIKLCDPSRYPRAPWKRMFDSMNSGLSGGEIGLSMLGTDRTLDQALDAVEKFRPKS
ncbi:STM3941 family protein [uncultured Brevundimonas sp.]|uniref:STM3941 family protein n=1 Tax=uncultured Brevundimonas sp. TaxID=213418 RepID=UPI00260F216F|nr:STM3941 family protein [uncultured Brevundimonas sp.]